MYPIVGQIYNTAKYIGYVLSVISILLLVEEGLNFGLGAPLTTLLKIYQGLVDLLFSRFDPHIAALLNWINSFVFFELKLNPWWKYSAIPMWIYFGSAAYANIKSHKAYTYALVNIISGAFLAFTSSVIASEYPINSISPVPVWIIAMGFVAFSLVDITYHALFLSRQIAHDYNTLLFYSLHIHLQTWL